MRRLRPKSGAGKTISIIIPVYNQLQLTTQCIESLQNNSFHFKETEVIVVDDGSTDGTAGHFTKLSRENHWLKYHRNTSNLKFARSCNAGAELATGEFLIFLNNDTLVTQDWDRHLVETIASDRDIWMVGAKCLYPDRKIQHAGVYLPELSGNKLGHVYRLFPEYFPPANIEKEVQCVTAACMIMRRTDFQELGGFDTIYKNGLEDVDLCLRVISRGKKIRYQPRCVIIHFESKSEGRYDHAAENLQLLNQRWMDTVKGDYFDSVETDIRRCLQENSIRVAHDRVTLSNWTEFIEINSCLRPNASGNLVFTDRTENGTITIPAVYGNPEDEHFLKINCNFKFRPFLKIHCSTPNVNGKIERLNWNHYLDEGSHMILLRIPNICLGRPLEFEFSQIKSEIEFISLEAYSYRQGLPPE